VGWQGRKAALWSLIVFMFLIALLIFRTLFFQTIHNFV